MRLDPRVRETDGQFPLEKREQEGETAARAPIHLIQFLRDDRPIALARDESAVTGQKNKVAGGLLVFDEQASTQSIKNSTAADRGSAEAGETQRLGKVDRRHLQAGLAFFKLLLQGAGFCGGQIVGPG